MNEEPPNPKDVGAELEDLRTRLNRVRQRIGDLFVGKQEVVDLMVVCALAGEPLLIVGKPGTAKSDLVVKFCEALGLGEGEYFEYMLTKFTEPSEIIGPVDIRELKEGRYLRKTGGKLPECRVAFLDEIFKSNSAILNTLLTLVNERKYYQDGQPVAVPLEMLFAATNEIPEFEELAALRDRFVVKVESPSVSSSQFEELLVRGLRNESMRALGQRPWAGLSSLDDFRKVRFWLDHQLRNLLGEGEGDGLILDDPLFPDEVFKLFRRIIRTLVQEDRIEISDRRVIKLYRLVRARALLFHGGRVSKDDLVVLRYTADRVPDFGAIRQKVDSLLSIGG